MPIDQLEKKPTRRGTDHSNDRGSAEDRRRRVAWLISTFASNITGFARCYRCGKLLFNLNDPPASVFQLDTGEYSTSIELVEPLTVDRIIPGCRGGKYRRDNIRPACWECNVVHTGSITRKVGTVTRKASK